MENRIIVMLLLLWGQVAYGQNVVGTWNGELNISGMKMPIVFHISEKEGKFITSMDSPKQNVKGIPTSETTFTDGILNISIKSLNANYQGEFLSKDTLSGKFTQGGMKLDLFLKRGEFKSAIQNRPQEPKPPFNYFTEEVTFINPEGGNTLAGTISAPTSKKNSPIYILITGSGAQNRDSEIMGHKPFWVIADDLARNGIATLRLDDRGVGKSTGAKETDTSYDFATDIHAAVNYLAKQGYKNIGLIGHSEGGMIAPIVATMNKKVKSMILLAAPGIPVTELMELQIYHTNVASGMPKFQAQIAASTSRKLYDIVKDYNGKDIKTDLRNEFKKILPTMDSSTVNSQIAILSSPWYRYFISFEPVAYLSKIKIPVLALNGSLDVQVPAKENLDGIANSMKKNKKIKTVELDKLNHLFQTAKTGAVSEYENIEETFSPIALEQMRTWILGL